MQLSPIIKVWAIQHITTGNYLPFNHVKRGYSYDEPSTKTRPRLFYSHRSAKMALQAWLKGNHKPQYGFENEGFGSYRVWEGNSIEEVPYRKTLVMRIVEFNLVDQAPLEI